MNTLIERLSKMNARARAGAAIGVYVVILAVFFVGCYRGKTDQKSTLQDENANLLEQRDDKLDTANNKERFERELDELNDELARMVRQLPENQDIPNLLDSVSQVGRKLGLEFAKWQSRKETVKDFYAEVPVEIEVDGAYHDVAMFFDKIANLDRIINVRDMKFGSPVESAGKVMLRTEGTIVAFRQLTPSEIRAATAQAEAEEKGK
jgi:type IV pilus assembly protein PilO